MRPVTQSFGRYISPKLKSHRLSFGKNDHAPRPQGENERASRGRRPDCVPPRLQARLRRHRLEAAQFSLPLGTNAELDQGQEPREPGNDAGVGAVVHRLRHPRRVDARPNWREMMAQGSDGLLCKFARRCGARAMPSPYEACGFGRPSRVDCSTDVLRNAASGEQELQKKLLLGEAKK